MTNPFFCYGKGLRLTGTWTRRAGVVQRHSAGSDREADNTLASPLAHRRVDHPHQEQLEVQTAGARKPAPPVILTATELPSPLLASTSELAADPNDPVVTKDARNIPVFSPASSRAAAQDLVGDSTPNPLSPAYKDGRFSSTRLSWNSGLGRPPDPCQGGDLPRRPCGERC